MPDSSDLHFMTENQATDHATARSAEAQNLSRLQSSSPGVPTSVASQGSTELTSIRGIPERASKGIAAVLEEPSLRGNPQLSSIYLEEIKQLWLVARLDPKLDRGAELTSLLKLFCEDETLRSHPELLSQLHRVATAESLFGFTREQYQEQGIDFNKIRREFLVDLIRGAIDSDNITQGKEPLCTMGALGKIFHSLTKAEFLRVSTEYALNGSVETASGAEMRVWPQFVTRAYASSEATLGEVKCARRSAGMLMMLYGMLQLGDTLPNPSVPLVERQQGLYWHQYTRAAEKLLGERLACMHRSADGVLIDEATGFAVTEAGGASTRKVGLMQYVEDQLARGRPVFVDTLFNFSSATVSSGNEHCRHAIVAESVEVRNGQRWIRCSNPIGDFVDTSKSSAGHAEFYPPGTILGNPKGFWCETGPNGDIFVRADIFQKNIQTALVRYGTSFKADNAEPPTYIGDRAFEQAGPIFFFDPSVDVTEIEPEATAVTISSVVEDLFAGRKAPMMREDRGDEEASVVDRTSSRREMPKRRSLEEELLAAQVAAQQIQEQEAREEKRESEAAKSSGFSSAGASSHRAVVGSAFEYGRADGGDATSAQGKAVAGPSTPVAHAAQEPVTLEATSAAGPAKPPSTPMGSTTAFGLKTLFG